MPNARRFAAFVLLAVPSVASAQFVSVAPRHREDGEPRVFLWRAENLVDARDRVRNNDKRLKAAWQRLEKEANAALKVAPMSVMDKRRVGPSGDKHDYVSLAPYWWPDSTKPNGLPYIQRDGEVNPESRMDSDSPAFGKMVDAVETLALGAFIFNDTRYADHAAQMLRTWFLDKKTRMNPNLEYAQGIPGVTDGRGIGIIDTRDMARIVDAVGLIEATEQWSDRDELAMKAWCRDFLAWLRTSKNGQEERAAKNNHGTWYDAQVAALALFVDDTALARTVITQSTAQRLAEQMLPTGELPLESARTRPLHYTLFTLEPYERLAELGRLVGADLWRWKTASGATLQQGARFVAQYADSTVKMPKADVTPVPPDEFLLPLRRAVQAFGDPVIAAAIEKIPASVRESDRSRLLYPDVP